jgi:N-methylhydantoinase A
VATRLGVDIGGTFTDLVYYDESTGRTVEGKVPTVPNAPEDGVVDAIRRHVPREVIRAAECFLHGTTVGLNALLERRGATVGLITTRGFRDVLEIRRGDRTEMYNLFWRQPEPLVPRARRLEVDERVTHDGSILRPLDKSSIPLLVAEFRAHGVDSIAVCLLHSYANPAHEIAIESVLRSAGFEGGISLSHRLSGEYREYERTSTTVVDAFVRARMAQYLRRLDTRLRELGFRGTSLIARSGGGSMTFSEAEDRPFETIMSGPVGGAEGAAELGRRLAIPRLITADVGGTSFDTTLVIDGRPRVLYQGEIDHMPIQSPWVDVRSIGSGGGSIAAVDAGGLLRVGPESAGAVPGPAAYGKGGTEPTLTDATAFLGMLGSGKLAAGIILDKHAAGSAFGPAAAALQRSVEEVAIGTVRIASAAMANAIREVTIEQGLDPREFVLLPFGGAGPLMACLLADELGIPDIIVPRLAGNFSAWGLLGADMVQSASRTLICALTAEGIAAAERMSTELLRELETHSVAPRAAVAEVRIDLRYRGQEHWLSIPVHRDSGSIRATVNELAEEFASEYRRTFGSTLDESVEIVAVRAGSRTQLPARRVPDTAAVASSSSLTEIPGYSFRLGQWTSFREIERNAISEFVVGPAIVSESTTTLYLDAGWQARVGVGGELRLSRVEIMS